MSVISAIQDPQTKGGIGTVVGWYLEWMSRHRPEENRAIFLEDERTLFSFARKAPRWREDDAALPRLLPRLQVPQYFAARALVSARVSHMTEGHVIGATMLHGMLIAGRCPMLTWFGPTIMDEKKNLGTLDPGRAFLNRATLPFLQKLERRVAFSAARNLAQSPHGAELLVRMGVPASRIEVRPVPVDTERFRPGAGARHGVLWVGRARDPRKNFGVAVRLLALSHLVRERGLKVVSQQRWHRIDPSVDRFIEHVSEVPDIAPIYRSAEIFLLTSRQEGFGIAVFEALASGTAVVAVRSGGPDRFIEDSGGGILVDDERHLRSVVEHLLSDDSARSQLADSGRRWVEREMSATRFLDDSTIFTL